MVDGAENLNSAKKKKMNETINNIICSFGNFSPFLQALLFSRCENLLKLVFYFTLFLSF